MSFEPKINIGDILTNDTLRSIFKCGNMGGMRLSKTTKTLVIISDMTKGFYHDKWIDGVLLYTGMGKYGDQVLKGNQNRTLYESDSNGIAVHLFEVYTKTQYTYEGQVKLVAAPYQTNQPDEEGRIRQVWIFPVKPITEIQEDLDNPDPAKMTRISNSELDDRSTKLSKEEHEPTVKETKVYYRNPYLKEAVKRVAAGKCQLCKQEAPFFDSYGEPYLEEHHIVRLADGGSDTFDNVVAICPNCHRKVHVLNDDKDISILVSIARKNEDRFKHLIQYRKINK